MTSKMKDDDFNIKLIQLVEQRPCLYDFNNPDYCNRNEQDIAWLEIAREINELVVDCKERWKNIRGCYTRYLKRNSRPSGSSAKYVKPYYLANKLQFLDGFTKTRPQKGMFKTEDMNIEMDWKIPNELDEESFEDSRDFDKPFAPASADEVEGNKDFENYSPPTTIFKKPKKVSLSEVNASAMEYFKSKQKNIKYENLDPDLAFLYSLLPDVKDMSREQKRRFKMGVLKVVNEILEESTPASSANTSNQPAL